MRIVVDAMGSDNYPEPDVAGAVEAAKEFGDTIILVGDEGKIKSELSKYNTQNLKLEVIHASDVITMHDKPSQVGKSKPNSSMHIGMNLVKDGQADAFVSAGNTGAALSIATLFTLRRIEGVKRPALSAIVRLKDAKLVLTDVGANADCKPDWLAQFAVMGSVYAKNALNLEKPRVAILSNGEEEGKGNQLTQEAKLLIQELPINFIGNIEPKEMLEGGADVVVCDGFVGNVCLKSLEGATSTMARAIRQEIMAGIVTKIGGLLVKPAFQRVQKQIDPFETGGAPLLGVNGVVIIGHGRSNAKAIKNAVVQARNAVSGRVIDTIKNELGK